MVLMKVETFNPGHSIKDRMALKMLEDAEDRGDIRPGFAGQQLDKLRFLGFGFGLLCHSIFSILFRQVESDPATEQSPEPRAEKAARGTRCVATPTVPFRLAHKSSGRMAA